jgi:hypothetical protein
MSATAFTAMLQAGKVSGTGERQLKKHLCTHLGVGFCPTRQSVDMLADGHSMVHYDCINFTYNGKEKADKIEWMEKDIDEQITMYLQRRLKSKAIAPSNVERVQVVVGGNHGDVAFQFGMSITVETIDGQIIEFKISVCKVICRKDTAKLIECTILPQLTNGLEVLKLIPLCISVNTDDGKLVCKYNHTPSIGSTTSIVDVYITGNLAFQVMALGEELIAGHWCMQCASSKA